MFSPRHADFAPRLELVRAEIGEKDRAPVETLDRINDDVDSLNLSKEYPREFSSQVLCFQGLQWRLPLLIAGAALLRLC